MSDFFSEATASFLGPIKAFLEDPDIAEIMVNGPEHIFIERHGKILKTQARFKDVDELMAAIRRIGQMVGKIINEQTPIMDARLEDGSRVHVVLSPSARTGPYLTIRKFQEEKMSLRQLVEKGALNVDMAKFLNLVVQMAKNIIVSGGTSSGKTTLLNVVSSLIPPQDRIVVIEDAAELQLRQEHVLSLETKAADSQGEGAVSMRDLVKASLRMRPDRIVVGEVRGAEGMDLIQAINTGHGGSMATIHANSPLGAIGRLETLAMMSDVNMPIQAIRGQICSALDIIIQTTRLQNGQRKIIAISEVLRMKEQAEVNIQDLYVLRVKQDKKTQNKPTNSKLEQVEYEHVATGILPSFFNKALEMGYDIDKKMFSAPKTTQKN
ncbi:MAG TPA: CpaF family protein [Oligoflexia bacterium]|nr:CpaF family protein [Oligoflexia bacterium]HMR24949.1 CpaF family protein [Oligoflexia bacterium]